MKKLLIIYLVIFVLFTLFTYLYIDPNFLYLNNLFTGYAYQNRLIVSLIYFVFIITLFVVYLFVLKSKHKDIFNFKNFLLLPLIGVLAYPAALSFDLFNYVATARVTFHYLENPYIIMPIEFTGDPILLFTHAANKIALYGPIWIGLTALPYYLSFGNYLIAVVLFKLFVSFFYFGIVYLIWRMTKSAFSVLYFAANPLVLIETFVSGHNDVVMMFFALLSFYLLKKNKLLYSILIIIVSILIKYATVFLIPTFAYCFYKKIRHQEISWDKIYFANFVLMLIIFFISPIREEIYPWYAIWPLTFFALVSEKRKNISYIFAFFTFCLMLRYIPFMLLGTYFGPTPFIKLIITFLLPLVFVVFLFSKRMLNKHT